MYVTDVVRGIIAALDGDAAAGQIVTLSGGVGVPTGAYFDHYARMLGRRSVPRAPRSVMIAAAATQAGLPTDWGALSSSVPRRCGTWPIAAARTASTRPPTCCNGARR